jgi:hypothetical protein
MTESNPFNAATTILRVKVASRGEGPERRELEAAIRLLEAAGKVDKEMAVTVLKSAMRVIRNDNMPGLFACVAKEVLPIFEALPDKETP